MSLEPAPKHIRDKFKAELEQIIAAQPKPIVFLPLMTKPVRSVEKENAEKYMRELLDKTRAELRLPSNG